MNDRRGEKRNIFSVPLFTHLSAILQIISNDISELQQNQATTVAKIAQYKRKLMDLSHRVLQVVASSFLLLWKYGVGSAFSKNSGMNCDEYRVSISSFPAPGNRFTGFNHFCLLFSWKVLIKQEIQRKSGYAIQVDEEHLRVQLDTIQSELNAPTQFKVSVSEL